jgi:hypothetical protein
MFVRGLVAGLGLGAEFGTEAVIPMGFTVRVGAFLTIRGLRGAAVIAKTCLFVAVWTDSSLAKRGFAARLVPVCRGSRMLPISSAMKARVLFTGAKGTIFTTFIR